MSAAARQSTSPAPVESAVGHLAENWPALNSAAPAVIVNPAAAPADVLAWCYGEVQSLCGAVSVISMGAKGCDADDFDALIAHRIFPLTRIFERALDALALQTTAAARAGADHD